MRHLANTLGQKWAIISEQPINGNYFRYNQSEAQRIELADKLILIPSPCCSVEVVWKVDSGNVERRFEKDAARFHQHQHSCTMHGHMKSCSIFFKTSFNIARVDLSHHHWRVVGIIVSFLTKPSTCHTISSKIWVQDLIESAKTTSIWNESTEVLLHFIFISDIESEWQPEQQCLCYFPQKENIWYRPPFIYSKYG